MSPCRFSVSSTVCIYNTPSSSENCELLFVSTGGRYLTIPEVGNKRTGRGARLVLPLTPPWNDGNLCLSFRHKLAGHHVGMLQVFVKKGKQYSPAVWGRTGGNGWRHTQITLWGTGLESVSITSNMFVITINLSLAMIWNWNIWSIWKIVTAMALYRIYKIENKTVKILRWLHCTSLGSFIGE